MSPVNTHAASTGDQPIGRHRCDRTVRGNPRRDGAGQGALMLAYHLDDADAAFALLVWHSQQSNRTLHTIADELVARVSADGLVGRDVRTHWTGSGRASR
jgi:ANTAR domain